MIKIPTHFRFKDPKEAEHWDRTIEDYIAIDQIHFRKNGVDISSTSFAWVYDSLKKPTLEYFVRPIILCKICKDRIVEKKGEVCDYCNVDL